MRWPWTKPEPAPAPVREPPRFRVSSIALAQVAAANPTRPPPGAASYVLPTAAPGVLPAGVTMAQDASAADLYAGYATQGAFGEGIGFLGYPYLAELAQRAEYRRITETIAKEMTRKWIRLTSASDDDTADKLVRLDAAMKKFRVRDMFRMAAAHDGFFGRGHLFMDFGDWDKPEELKTPLIVRSAKIAVGSLRRLATVEPLWSYPSAYNSTDPLAPDYYRPAGWYVQGREVHRTRLLTFIGREVPDILKPAYMFGGLSLSQMAKPYVDNWLRTRQSVSDLLASFSIPVLSTNMDAVLQGGGVDDLLNRGALFNQLRSTRGLMMLDKDTEAFTNVSTPLAGLDHLQAQSQEHMASVSGIPLVKLLGITPSGLNASSDGEIRVFYDWVHAQQEDLFTDHLKTVLDVLQLNEFGEIDPGIGFVFEPLWQLDEVQAATVRKTNADTDAVYTTMGAVTNEEVRQRIGSDDEGLYASVDLDAPLPEPEPIDLDAPIDAAA